MCCGKCSNVLCLSHIPGPDSASEALPSSRLCGTKAPCAEQAALCRQIPLSAIEWFKLRRLGATARGEIPVHLLALENCLVAFFDAGLPPPQSTTSIPGRCSARCAWQTSEQLVGLFFPPPCAAFSTRQRLLCCCLWSSRERSQVELPRGGSFTTQGRVPAALSGATSRRSAFMGHHRAAHCKCVLWHFTGWCSSSAKAVLGD